jgi:alkaline phosphatase
MVFAAIADSHIRDAGYRDLRYIKAMDRCGEVLAACVRDINAHIPQVDFAVHLGDLTDLGATREFEIARAIMDSLDCPLYPVLGNHDNFKSDHKAGWLAFAGRDSATYSFDFGGLHFIVIDCTLDPYQPPYVNCDSTLRAWVAEDLAANWPRPTVVLSHFNMWQRHWNAMFDTTRHYAEYRGMPEMRGVLEDAGNVAAVVNGHVHANRVEKHNGIYYLDLSATIVGPPSIRYFYVYPDRIEVDFEYLSDEGLFNHVTDLCDECCCCFSREEVCSFVDGTDADKRFAIPLVPAAAGGPAEFAGAFSADDARFGASAGLLAVATRSGRPDAVRAVVSSGAAGTVDISLHDVLGRRLGRCCLWKNEPVLDVNLCESIDKFRLLPPGIYFLRVSLGEATRTEKMVLLE